MHLGSFIRQRRDELNMSQQDLATRLTLLGHTTLKASVGHWERGRNDPPLMDAEFRSALAHALQMDVTEMMVRMGLVKIDLQGSQESRLAAEIVERLPEDKRQLAVELLKALEKEFA